MKDDEPLGPKKNMIPSEAPAKTGLTREVQAKIGQQLRAIYNDVVDQGVPDRFVDLLNKLDQGGAGKEGKGPDKESQ